MKQHCNNTKQHYNITIQHNKTQNNIITLEYNII